MNGTPVFQVMIPDQDSALDVFGLWQAETRESAYAENIIASISSSEKVGSVWHADLPNDPLEAARLLNAQAFLQRQTRQALPTVQQRLQADLRALPTSETGSAFAFASAWRETGVDSPRSVLQIAAEVRWQQTSYNALDRIKLDPLQIELASQAVSQFAAQVRRTVEHLALVETAVGGNTIGVTRVAWSGDMETWWASGLSPEHFAQHKSVLVQALATRQNWLRFLLIFTSGTVRVAATLTTGPFSLLSIWATWNYLQQVVKEYHQLRVRT